MRFVRTMLAFAIVVSLAMLPLGASAVGHAIPSDDMQMAVHNDMSMNDCCPDDMKAPVSHMDGKCIMSFCCTSGALALGDVRSVQLRLFAVAANTVAIPADQVISHLGGSPPFRPPRS